MVMVFEHVIPNLSQWGFRSDNPLFKKLDHHISIGTINAAMADSIEILKRQLSYSQKYYINSLLQKNITIMFNLGSGRIWYKWKH
jgi:hypothetical protein